LNYISGKGVRLGKQQQQQRQDNLTKPYLHSLCSYANIMLPYPQLLFIAYDLRYSSIHNIRMLKEA